MGERLRLSEARFYKRIYLRSCAENENAGMTKEEGDALAMENMKTVLRHDLKIKKVCDEIWEEVCGKPNKAGKVNDKYFLTIRPSDEMSLDTFYKLVKKIMARRLWIHFHLVWEQKGECIEDLGKGKHIHAVLTLRSPAKGKKFHLDAIINEVRKANLQDLLTANNIDLRKITDEKNLSDTYRYIDVLTFGKHDVRKKESWSLDAEWRSRVHLKPVYEYIDDFDEVLGQVQMTGGASPPSAATLPSPP
jgi:hypothetical protein